MGSSTEKFRCFSCGRWTKDVLDGPSPDDENVNQVHRWTTGVLRVEMVEGPYRAAVACWACFWKTEPDMWIRAEHWDALKPLVPAAELPLLLDSDLETMIHDDPASYQWPAGISDCKAT